MIKLKRLLFIPLYTWLSKSKAINDTVAISNVTEGTTPVPCVDLNQLSNRLQSKITYDGTLRYPQLRTHRFVNFYECLGRYSIHGFFDYTNFDSDRIQLNKELQSIQSDYMEIAKHSADFTKYLHSIKDLFKAMVKASAFIKRAQLSNDPFHKIFAEIYELKVLSMSMFNIRNESDRRISDYCRKVKVLSARFFAFAEIYSSSIAVTPNSLLSKISEISIEIERSLKRLTCFTDV